MKGEVEWFGSECGTEGGWTNRRQGSFSALSMSWKPPLSGVSNGKSCTLYKNHPQSLERHVVTPARAPGTLLHIQEVLVMVFDVTNCEFIQGGKVRGGPGCTTQQGFPWGNMGGSLIFVQKAPAGVCLPGLQSLRMRLGDLVNFVGL